MSSISRLSFLKQFVGMPVAAFLASPDILAAFEPIQHVGPCALKPALNAYSFLELLNANAKDPRSGIDLFGVCEFAEKQDFDAVDLTGYFFPGYPKTPDDRYLARIKKHVHDLGLVISGTGVRNDFTTADKAARLSDVQLIKQWIEVAAKLGAPTLRLFADSQKPFNTWQEASGGAARESVEQWMAEHYIECADHAQRYGVILAVQNHGDFIRTGEQHLSLLQRVNHEWCAALVDTGKYITDDPYVDIALMVPYAVNWQIKETLRSRTDSPRTDFQKLVKILRDGGYRGYLPIETLSMRRQEYDPFVEVVKVLGELRTAIRSGA